MSSGQAVRHSEENTPLLQKSALEKGVYRPSSATDLRGPCPVINSLANHGYIARDGRNIRAHEMKTAMRELGISTTIRTVLTYAAFLERQEKPRSGIWAFLRNPFAYLLGHFALRDPDQKDSEGVPCLNQDQLDQHGAVEHDVSMSRRDFAQGDNSSPQRDLIAEMLASSRDGATLSTQDWADFRKKRIEQQRKDNAKLEFGSAQNMMGSAEAAFIQKVFGAKDGRVPVSYAKALFEEERLPIKEGWKKRNWWLLGFIELTRQAQAVVAAVGSIG